MKKLLLTTALVAGMSASVFAQGTVYVDNSLNSTAGTTATAGGLIYVKTGAPAPVLLATDVSFALLAGTSSSSLVLVTTGTGATEAGDFDAPGLFTDNRQVPYSLAAASVPGGGTAWLELEVWQGTTIASYAAAQAAQNEPTGYAIFQNAVGTVGSTSPAPTLTGMPALVMTTPEPSTMVLGGLGAAALLLFRRRK
jgi:hypothetical protein